MQLMGVKLSKHAKVAIIILSMIFFVSFFVFVNEVSKIPAFPLNNEKLDAIVVLTGGKNRIDYALAFASSSKITNIFISGVNEKTSLEDILKNRNFDVNIALGKRALNTSENALEILEWVDKTKVKKFFLVTSDYHIPRSLLALQKVLNGSLQIIPIAVPSNHNYDFIKNCFKEFVKIIFFRLFYAICNIRIS